MSCPPIVDENPSLQHISLEPQPQLETATTKTSEPTRQDSGCSQQQAQPQPQQGVLVQEKAARPQNPQTEEREPEIVTTSTSAASKLGPLDPSRSLTGHQWFYIFVLDGLGGMIVSAAINFAIAYVMYTTQDTHAKPIRLFQLPNTLAGDAAVTILVQCILTWFVEKGLVAHDLGARSVQPIGFVSEPSSKFLRWVFFLQPQGPDTTTFVSTAVQNALRGFMLAVPCFMMLWPISVGALAALGVKQGGDWGYSPRWVPEIFKLVLGGLLGLLTTPLMAVFWLLRAGWTHSEGSCNLDEQKISV